MTDKKSYLQKLISQLEQWDAVINELKMKADKTETQSRNELYRQIEELRMKQEQVRDKLKQLQSAEDSAWEDMKTGVEKSWGELKSAFSQASARFKNT